MLNLLITTLNPFTAPAVLSRRHYSCGNEINLVSYLDCFFLLLFYFSSACNVYMYLTCFIIINLALFFAGTENALIAVVTVLGILLIVFSIVIWRLRRKLVITSSEPNLTTRLI